jgi:hypothetical protein
MNSLINKSVFISISSSTTSSNNAALSKPHSNNTVADISSPLIQEDGDNKVLKLRFDVSQYAPEEIVVKTVDSKLLVSTLELVVFLKMY